MFKRNAFHEKAAAFGPCEGPTTPHPGGHSWFCEGFGTERIDPLADDLRGYVACFPCHAMREGMAVREQRVEELAA